MEWQPQDEPLRQLACCLRDSLNAYDRNAQKQAEQVCFLPCNFYRSPRLYTAFGSLYHHLRIAKSPALTLQ